MRVEIIALHAASSYPGAQMYMECAQINVTGGGSANPPTVNFPGAYHSNDPGIVINVRLDVNLWLNSADITAHGQIYYPTPTTYTIPGPTPFTC